MSAGKKTLVMGASLNPARYSNMAIRRLLANGHEVYAIGLREGMVDGVKIEKGMPDFKYVHTITLYLNAKNQESYYDYFFSLDPARIIFNPGAENRDLFDRCRQKNIEPTEACTLVMLSIGVF